MTVGRILTAAGCEPRHLLGRPAARYVLSHRASTGRPCWSKEAKGVVDHGLWCGT